MSPAARPPPGVLAKNRITFARQHRALDQQEDHQHQDDEGLDDPDGEVGEPVAQLLDQEGAVGVAQPVDRPRLRQEPAQVGLVADQVVDPALTWPASRSISPGSVCAALNRLSAVRLAT